MHECSVWTKVSISPFLFLLSFSVFLFIFFLFQNRDVNGMLGISRDPVFLLFWFIDGTVFEIVFLCVVKCVHSCPFSPCVDIFLFISYFICPKQIALVLFKEVFHHLSKTKKNYNKCLHCIFAYEFYYNLGRIQD